MSQLKIGNIIRVESGYVEVVLTIDDLDVEHDGRIYRVGQLSSYVTIPLSDRTLVGFVTGCGRQETALAADLEPQCMMKLQLLGEIQGGKFIRGVNEYPVVGDDVWVAVETDFEAIFGSFDQLLAGSKHAKSFTLGKFASNQNFEVKVLGTEFLNKHAAILGNSGAGKSVTTTRVLKEIVKLPQSQVVLFDMHGEYRAAFSDEQGNLDPNVTYLGTEDLVLPYWLLKYEELETLFIDKSNPLHVSSQISFLRSAILEFKRDAAMELGLDRDLTLDTPIYFSLERLKTYAENLNEARYVLNSEHLAFNRLALRSMEPEDQWKLMRSARCEFNKGNPEGETPHPLYFGKLTGFIDSIDTRYHDRRYEFLLRPIEHSMDSQHFGQVLNGENTEGAMSDVMEQLIRVLCGRLERRRNLTIIDLSGIPFDVVDVTVAVVTRLLFDLNFWTPVKDQHPILMVYEEAHNYIPRTDNGRRFAREAVERVAKEGRKYGVTAMIISQRPSELSETVLAQCNNMLVMRLNNPDDQHYVERVVSDHFSSLVDMLPILRRGEAFVLGDSVLMPLRTLVQAPERFPRSGDCDFFKLWSGDSPGGDFTTIIDHWWRQDRQILNQVGSTGEQAETSPQEPEPEVQAEPASLDVPIAEQAPEAPAEPAMDPVEAIRKKIIAGYSE